MQDITKEKQKEIIIEAISTAQETLSQNNTIIEKSLPEEQIYSSINRNIILMMNDVKYKVENELSLNPAETSLVNRSIIDYITKLEQVQTNVSYMAQDLNDLKPFKDKIESAYRVQMSFNAEISLEQSQSQTLRRNMGRPSF